MIKMREFENGREGKKNRREKRNGLEQYEKYKEFKTIFYQLLSQPHVTYFSVVLIYFFIK